MSDNEMGATLVARLEAVARQTIAGCSGDALVEGALVEALAQGAVAGARPPRVVGAGKAVTAMAVGALRGLGPDRFRGGPLLAKHSLAGAPAAVTGWLRLASHPIPDERGDLATRELLACVAEERDGLVVLISGGASALLGAPADGISRGELARVTAALLGSGEPIARFNCVRKHLCRALGGRLAAARRGPEVPLLALALSDVVGDDPATIASGPVSPDPSRFAEALEIVRGAGVVEGEAVRLLEAGARGEVPESPKPGDPRLAGVTYQLLATPVTLRERAAERARAAGLAPAVEPILVEGDVAAVAARYLARAATLAPGEVVVAVGEPTVRLAAGAGQGGRSQQLALDVALGLRGLPAARELAFAAVGSDGTDGPTDAAGAVVGGALLAGDGPLGAEGPALARAALDGNDAYPLLARLGALVVTGGTGTNLLDLHLLARAPRW